MITVVGIRMLGGSEIKNLRILVLGTGFMLFVDNNSLGPKGMRYLGHLEWPHLSILSLSTIGLILEGNNLSHAGMQHLAKMKLPRLRTLFIGSNKITHEGGKMLTKGDWPLLRSLKISSLDFFMF